MKWTLEEGGTLGEGSEQSPVQYPRSEEARQGGYPKFEENMEGMDEMDGGTA